MDTGPGVLTILGSLFFNTLCDVGIPLSRIGGANFADGVPPFTAAPLVPIDGRSKVLFSLETFSRNNP
jgi:hypothetical protein